MKSLCPDTRPNDKPYAVNLWGSDPQAGNDDCNTGGCYATREKALAVYNNPSSDFSDFSACTAFVEIDGPDIYESRPNPDYVETVDDDSDWVEEMARQNGMAFGCDGYNDTYGW